MDFKGSPFSDPGQEETGMEELDIYNRMNAIAETPQFSTFFGEESEQSRRITEHKAWLHTIRRERPATTERFRIGVYIRYFNQTKYENYLAYHKKQFIDTICLCPNWELVDFYIDEGASAPNMETAPEWCRLIQDCFDGKVNLIITQKVSNVSKKPHEITLLSRILAAQKPSIGIYFISEDIFTLATYYRDDLKDTFFLPGPDWKLLPDEDEAGAHLND